VFLVLVLIFPGGNVWGHSYYQVLWEPMGQQYLWSHPSLHGLFQHWLFLLSSKHLQSAQYQWQLMKTEVSESVHFWLHWVIPPQISNPFVLERALQRTIFLTIVPFWDFLESKLPDSPLHWHWRCPRNEMRCQWLWTS
jgi:hypothetical protein